MRRRRALRGILAVTVLSALVGLGFRLEWWSIFADPDKGVWPWVEATSWVVAMITGVMSVIGTRSRPAAELPATAVVAPAGEKAVLDSPTYDSSLRDRVRESELLRSLLDQSRPSGVIQVSGDAGFGKTKFVDVMIEALEVQESSLTVRWHTVGVGSRFDVRTLIGDILGMDRPVELQPGQTRVTCLERALRHADQARIIIILENAENLAISKGSRSVDLQMHEALEVLHRHSPPHRTTVLLVSRISLESPARRLWAQQPPIAIGPLPKPDFKDYLQDCNAELGDLSEPRREMLYQRLAGNPRCVQLMVATIELSEQELAPDDLLETIIEIDPRDMPRRLGEILIANLSEVRRRAIQAVAAFATPVDAHSVTAVFDPPEATTIVAGALQRLEKYSLVVNSDAGYVLGFADAEWFTPQEPAERSALLRAVAAQLRQLRVADPRAVRDLRAHFAYVEVLLAARRFRGAYSAMEPMTGVLKQYNSEHLLLGQRERLQGNLGLPALEMFNDSELGNAYALIGEDDDSCTAYGRALNAANHLGDPAIRAQMRYNFGTHYWLAGRGDLAYGYYEEARQEAEQHGIPKILAAALTQLAEVHRRWGEYELAFARADQVLAEQETPALLLRVARWRTETGNTGMAGQLIKRARRASRGSDWLLAACHDAEADRLLADNDLRGAREQATLALEQAIQVDNPVAVLQAHTTLCWAHLYAGNLKEARQHIEDAAHYRDAGRALIVLALGALLKMGPDPTEAAQFFDTLAAEAEKRLADPKDRGARDVYGFARCSQALRSGASAEPAIQYFDTSTGGAAVLRARRNHLLKCLDEFAKRPGLLQPVLDAVTETPSRTID